MRDMSQVLERWSGWARSENNRIGYSHIAAGFKGLIAQKSDFKLSCSDGDGLIIDSCLSKLKQKKPDEYDVIFMHYFFMLSKRKISQIKKCDEKTIRVKIQLAEGFIEGCLSVIDVTLDMDLGF
ncbi:MAG TPA: antitermination protein Q [Pantoea ananatis]|nr:antitermination protein Q [Pantoea ananatis]